jgi:hypothetical protein
MCQACFPVREASEGGHVGHVMVGGRASSISDLTADAASDGRHRPCAAVSVQQHNFHIRLLRQPPQVQLNLLLLPQLLTRLLPLIHPLSLIPILILILILIVHHTPALDDASRHMQGGLAHLLVGRHHDDRCQEGGRGGGGGANQQLLLVLHDGPPAPKVKLAPATVGQVVDARRHAAAHQAL